MSPEELEHARCVMESHEALKKQTGRALLAHIDEQAKQIESWRQACFLRTQVVGQVERENHKQQDQIETLKAALQTAIAYEIACRLFLMPLNHCSIEQKLAALSDARNHIGEYIEEGAQLARDLPEIFGEDEQCDPET
ncbi:hypothetical protein M0R72_20345 [Candidatus Pacearchaeota archaeon]|jgi:small-conductance mechanosensitive channel|nr:hypothetical protein [Candidatus Pacearchaeota archaeon]